MIWKLFFIEVCWHHPVRNRPGTTLQPVAYCVFKVCSYSNKPAPFTPVKSSCLDSQQSHQVRPKAPLVSLAVYDLNVYNSVNQRLFLECKRKLNAGFESLSVLVRFIWWSSVYTSEVSITLRDKNFLLRILTNTIAFYKYERKLEARSEPFCI